MSDPNQDFQPDPDQDFVPDQAQQTDAPPRPDPFPAGLADKQDADWQAASNRGEKLDKLTSFLGGMVPFASKISGLSEEEVARAMKEHPWTSLGGQVVQQGAINAVLPGAGSTLGKKMLNYGLQGAAGHALVNTNEHPGEGPDIGGTAAAGLASSMLGPMGERGAEVVAKGLGKAAGWVGEEITGRPSVPSDSVEAITGKIDDAASKMSEFMGETGQPRVETLQDPRALQARYDELAASPPGLFNTRNKMLSDSVSRMNDAKVAEEALRLKKIQTEGTPGSIVDEYNAAADKAKSTQAFQEQLSKTTGLPKETGGSLSTSTIIPNIISGGLKGAVARVQTGNAVKAIPDLIAKLDRIAAHAGKDISGISPWETGVLRRELAGIAQRPPEEWPVLEYVLASTNPAYMALKRAQDENDEHNKGSQK